MHLRCQGIYIYIYIRQRHENVRSIGPSRRETTLPKPPRQSKSCTLPAMLENIRWQPQQTMRIEAECKTHRQPLSDAKTTRATVSDSMLFLEKTMTTMLPRSHGISRDSPTWTQSSGWQPIYEAQFRTGRCMWCDGCDEIYLSHTYHVSVCVFPYLRE